MPRTVGHAVPTSTMANDPMRSSLSIVVVTWNSQRVLPALLASIPGATAGVSDVELLIVDNGSSDGTRDLVAAHYPDARLIPMGRNAGYAAAINAGIRARRLPGPVLVLNPDICLDDGAVRAMQKVLDARSDVGIVAPRLRHETGAQAWSLRREPTVLRALGEALLGGTRAGRISALGERICDPRRYHCEGAADWATGAALLISDACLTKTGCWDESFFLYSEETDFALRARDAGFRLWYTPDAGAVHIGGDGASSPALWALMTTNRVRLYGRRHGRFRTVMFWAAVALNEGLRSISSDQAHRAALRRLFAMKRG